MKNGFDDKKFTILNKHIKKQASFTREDASGLFLVIEKGV